MTKVQIYDKAMCCSTGVCGPQVDPVLPRFAADLDWLKEQGIEVKRFNLAQNPEAFVKHDGVKQMLAGEGVECLPLVIVDDRIVSRSEYPSRVNLAMWTEISINSPQTASASTRPKAMLPMAGDTGCCDSDTDCC